MSEWALTRQRLALGVAPIDAVRRAGLLRPISVQIEVDGGASLVPMTRHASGHHVLTGPEGRGASLDLRLHDRRRAWVPRRVRVPLPNIDDTNVARRTRELVLFPGVNWDLVGGATALRGWVRRATQPVRWAWLEVREPGDDAVVMRTRADDRGEFLLVLNHDTLGPLINLPSALVLELRVHGPSVAPTPTPASDQYGPLWDLPIEQLAAPGAPDPTAAGEAQGLPSGWATLGDVQVTLTPGRTTTAQLDL